MMRSSAGRRSEDGRQHECLFLITFIAFGIGVAAPIAGRVARALFGEDASWVHVLGTAIVVVLLVVALILLVLNFDSIPWRRRRKD